MKLKGGTLLMMFVILTSVLTGNQSSAFARSLNSLSRDSDRETADLQARSNTETAIDAEMSMLQSPQSSTLSIEEDLDRRALFIEFQADPCNTRSCNENVICCPQT